MNTAALRELSRSELQKLASYHNVQGIFEDEAAIVEILIERFPYGVPPIVENIILKTKKPQKYASWKRPTRGTHPDQKSPLDSRLVLRSFPPTALSSGSRSSSRSGSTFSQDSVSDDDERTPNLERVVKDIMTVSGQCEAVLDKISNLRSLAREARSRAKDLLSVIRAERGQRERIEAYMRNWSEIDPAWSHRELWSDPIRIRWKNSTGTLDELSSDEESEAESDDVPAGALRTLKEDEPLPNDPRYVKGQRALEAAVRPVQFLVKNNPEELPLSSPIEMQPISWKSSRYNNGNASPMWSYDWGRSDTDEDDENSDRYPRSTDSLSDSHSVISVKSTQNSEMNRFDKGEVETEEEDFETGHQQGQSEEEIEQIVVLLPDTDEHEDECQASDLGGFSGTDTP